MNKKKIGIVAKKLNHSLSPFIHNYWSRNNNFIYRKYEVQEKNIDKFYPLIIVLDGDYLFEPIAGCSDYTAFGVICQML